MIVTADIESYYDQDYSLSKMSEPDYILDHRFEIIGCAVKEGNGPSDMFYGIDKVRDRMNKIDWTRAALLAHNTRFDGSILAWHLGISPKLYLDTLGMARAITAPWIGKSSLAAVSDYLGLPAKGTFVHNMRGKRLRDMTGGDLIDYATYCLRDNDNTYDIFQRFRPCFRASELELIDIMLRMFIEPSVKLDPNHLAIHLGQVQVERQAAFDRVAHIDKSVFSSNQKFADLLERMGVEVPRKISKTTGLETYALAKNDRAFKELCDDPDQPIDVQAVCMARLGAKSTIEETRTKRLLDHSLRSWGEHGDGWLAVPVRFYGAHTGRASGDGGINLQNLKRTSGIKKGIYAPPGMRIVHRDSSQIECRVNAWLAGCEKQLRAFAAGVDVYCEFGASIYGRPVTKADKADRFVSKTGILGLGYGMGAPRFRHTLFIGNGGMSLDVSEDFAKKVVYKYRDDYKEIPENNWAVLGVVIAGLAMQHRWQTYSDAKRINMNNTACISNPRLAVFDFRREGIIGPNGLGIAYPNLRVEKMPTEHGRMRDDIFYDGPFGDNTKLFGGKITENVVQYLARIVVTDIAVRVRRETGYSMSFFTHDSLDYVVPENEVEWWDKYLERQFAIRPSWAPDLPLASEGGWGLTLMDAEQGVNQ